LDLLAINILRSESGVLLSIGGWVALLLEILLWNLVWHRLGTNLRLLIRSLVWHRLRSDLRLLVLIEARLGREIHRKIVFLAVVDVGWRSRAKF